jgi:hypothetical protein
MRRAPHAMTERRHTSQRRSGPGTHRKHRTQRLAAVAAVLAPLALALASAAPAEADAPLHPTPALTLSNGSGSYLGQRWALSGIGFAPLATITVEVLQVNAAGTVQAVRETQTGLTTSPAGPTCWGAGLMRRCDFSPGGTFSTEGHVTYTNVPGVGEEPEAVDPLQCGHDYLAIALEWVDGVLTVDYATSNVLSEPACS